MKKSKSQLMQVQSVQISVTQVNSEDYFCITDMAKYKNPDKTGIVIANWLKSRNTVEFLGLWEKLNNPVFNVIEFDNIKKDVGLNSYIL